MIQSLKTRNLKNYKANNKPSNQCTHLAAIHPVRPKKIYEDLQMVHLSQITNKEYQKF